MSVTVLIFSIDFFGEPRSCLGVHDHHAVIADDDAGVWIALSGEGPETSANLSEGDLLFGEIALRGECLGHTVSSPVSSVGLFARSHRKSNDPSVLHLDAHRIAELHERGRWLAVADRFDHADFGDAGIAEATFGNRLARSAIASRLDTVPEPMMVPAAKRAGFCGMGNERRKVEGHVVASIGAAEGLAVEIDASGRWSLAAVPGVAEFIGRHRDRRKSR